LFVHSEVSGDSGVGELVTTSSKGRVVSVSGIDVVVVADLDVDIDDVLTMVLSVCSIVVDIDVDEVEDIEVVEVVSCINSVVEDDVD
jgi:hypothetical protein